MFGVEHVSVVDNFLILAGDNEKRDSKYNQETLNHKLEKKEWLYIHILLYIQLLYIQNIHKQSK